MFKDSALLVAFIPLLWANITFSNQVYGPSVTTGMTELATPNGTSDKLPSPQISKWDQFLRFMRGERPVDALFLGMWSHHLTKSFRYRQSHNLVALQYRGLYLATFVNSHSEQTFVVGIARTLYSTKILRDKIRFDFGYKVGPMYGYRNRVPNIKGFSILPLLTGGITYKMVGVDVNAVPGNALTMNFRLEKP